MGVDWRSRLWRNIFKMAAMTSFHAQKWCHLVSAHAAPAWHLLHPPAARQQFCLVCVVVQSAKNRPPLPTFVCLLFTARCSLLVFYHHRRSTCRCSPSTCCSRSWWTSAVSSTRSSHSTGRSRRLAHIACPGGSDWSSSSISHGCWCWLDHRILDSVNRYRIRSNKLYKRRHRRVVGTNHAPDLQNTIILS